MVRVRGPPAIVMGCPTGTLRSTIALAACIEHVAEKTA
jgi:hypothetical protein